MTVSWLWLRGQPSAIGRGPGLDSELPNAREFRTTYITIVNETLLTYRLSDDQ